LPLFSRSIGSASSSLPTPDPSAVCAVPNRLARSSALSASASASAAVGSVVVAPVPKRSARALRFLSSSSTDDAVRPMLRSTAEASLVSVVAEPSRDVGAGCGAASEVVSAKEGYGQDTRPGRWEQLDSSWLTCNLSGGRTIASRFRSGGFSCYCRRLRDGF
jgi:hypothetical protein